MSHTAPRRAALTHGLLGLLVALSVAGCAGTGAKAVTPSAPSISAAPVDPEVAATGLPDGQDVEVTDSTAGAEDGENISFVSPIYTVTPIGPLDQAATFTLRLDNALPEGTPIVVATREFERDAWTYQRGRISEDQGHVSFRATTLDQVSVLAIEPDGAVSSLRSDVRAGLFPKRTTGKKPAKPTCAQPDEALQSGYSANGTNYGTLFWCFGLQKDKRVVTVTNRRAVPVQVTHPRMEVVSAPRTPRAYATWSTVIGTAGTILAPGASATYDADLEPEAKVALVGSSTKQARALRVLQATSRALVKRLNAFGAGPVKPGATLADFLDAPRCVNALKAGVDAMAKHCFSPGQLRRSFGSRWLLLEPLVTTSYSTVFFGRLGDRLSTLAKNQRDQVSVSRLKPDFTALTGLWSGASRLLSVDGAGVATETLQSGTDLKVKLTYQLDYPVTKGDATTAATTLTSVQVGKRKLLKGPVPKVGAKGTMTVSKGVITPPYLKVHYCDSAAAKKKSCG